MGATARPAARALPRPWSRWKNRALRASRPVVDRRHAPRARDPDPPRASPRPTRRPVTAKRYSRKRQADSSSEDAGRLALLVGLYDPRPGRRDRRPRARGPAELSQRRWPSFGHERGRRVPVTASRSPFVGSSSGSHRRSASPSRQPAARRPRGATASPHRAGRPPRRPRPLEPNLALRQRPPGSDVRVGEPGKNAASAQVDALRARERGLVRPDAARDPVACDRERPRHRERRVHRPTTPFSRITRQNLPRMVPGYEIETRGDRARSRRGSRARGSTARSSSSRPTSTTSPARRRAPTSSSRRGRARAPRPADPRARAGRVVLERVEPLGSLRELPGVAPLRGPGSRAAGARARRPAGRAVPRLREAPRRASSSPTARLCSARSAREVRLGSSSGSAAPRPVAGVASGWPGSSARG